MQIDPFEYQTFGLTTDVVPPNPPARFRWLMAIYLLFTQVVFGLPLLIWPFALLASVMGLAGQQMGQGNLLILSVAMLFFISTIIYPVPYLFGLLRSWKCFHRHELAKAFLFSLISPIFFGIILLLGWLFATYGV